MSRIALCASVLLAELGSIGVSVAARWSLAYPDREEASGLTLIVLQRGGDGWSIIHDASM